MVGYFALFFFGRDVPAAVLVAVAMLLFAGYLSVSRSAPHRVGFRGGGVMHQCERCGFNFQPEGVEKMDDGSERHFMDYRCPHCGWSERNEPHPHFPV
jgi:hypothetical protein